jgi:NAD(P)-dependent dehydrogenase (short-subunit alcohol dehydrogenase family)
MRVALAARNVGKLEALAGDTGTKAFGCDASDPAAVQGLFATLDETFGPLDLVVYNASYRVRGPLVGLDPEEVRKTLSVSAFGGFLVGQEAARRMLARGRGAIFFTGASASVKGYAQSAPFAMGKFALRGLAQSMARELQPKNIHIAHFVIDGGIGTEGDPRGGERGADGMLDPDAIARTYLSTYRQHRSAWSSEIELRPWRKSSERRLERACCQKVLVSLECSLVACRKFKPRFSIVATRRFCSLLS